MNSKSQRYNQNMGNKSINITSRADSSQGTANQAINASLLQDYKSYQKNFYSRASIGASANSQNFTSL